MLTENKDGEEEGVRRGGVRGEGEEGGGGGGGGSLGV